MIDVIIYIYIYTDREIDQYNINSGGWKYFRCTGRFLKLEINSIYVQDDLLCTFHSIFNSLYLCIKLEICFRVKFKTLIKVYIYSYIFYGIHYFILNNPK